MATPAPPITDTTEPDDDGALHAFFRFLIRRRLRGAPDFDLEDVEQLRDAIREFEEGA